MVVPATLGQMLPGTGNLPSTLDAQYLGATLKVLKGMKKAK
jgi:hypothetical protein